MKILIIGGGIAGLSTYLHMKKHLAPSGEHEIKIFESHASRIASDQTQGNGKLNLDDLSSSTALVGGGLAVAPNGMRVLRDLSPGLHYAVTKQGFQCENNTFKAARGFTIGKARAWDARDPAEYTVSSSRYGLWKCLADEVGNDAVQFKKLTEVAVSESGKPLVRFVDGSEEEADLVVGADGVRSTVKKAILQDDDGKYAPTYNGLSGVGGFINQLPPQECVRDKSLCFTFGPNGFFGYAPASSTRTLWWSTCETSKIPDRKAIDLEAIYTQMKERHSFWKDSVLQDIIAKAGTIDSIYPTWETPPLPTWSRARMVLVGDAAHAMSPTSGQGASQAFEDAQTLSLLLARFLGQDGLTEDEAIERSARAYYEIRNPRVTNIRNRVKKYDSNKMPNQNIVAEYGMYFFLWLMNRFPAIGRLMMGDPTKELYHWDSRREIEGWVKKQAA